MFDLKLFIITNIVNGIKNGTFSKEYGNIMAVNYLVKGILTEENVAEIDNAITEWETELATLQEPNEELVEETNEEVIEETETVTEEDPAE